MIKLKIEIAHLQCVVFGFMVACHSLNLLSVYIDTQLSLSMNKVDAKANYVERFKCQILSLSSLCHRV